MSLAIPVVASAQAALSERDVQQVVQQAVRTALANANVGNRGMASDSAVVFDTTSLALASSDGARRYGAVSLRGVDVGRRVISGAKSMAFVCPARDVGDRISADCSPRGMRTYVRVGLLDVVDATSVTLWVSIIAPKNASPNAARSERFHNHNVQILVKKGPDGWTIGIPKTRAVG